MTRCHYCGFESESEQTFRKFRRSFSRKIRWVCQDCHVKKATKRFRGLLWYWLVVFFCGIALLFSSKPWIGYFLLNCWMLDILPLLLVLPHEFGHAIAGKAVGFRVFHVIVGLGRTLYKRRIMGFNFEIKTVFFGGVTIATPRSANCFRLRHALFIFAGPFVSVVIGWLAFILCPRPIWPHVDLQLGANPFLPIIQAAGQKLMPLQILLVANLYLLVASLWPRMINTSYGKIANDGLALLKTPFLKEEVIHKLLSARYIREASEAFHAEQYESAQRWAQDGLVRDSKNDLLKNLLVASLLRRGAFEEARAILVVHVQSPPSNPGLYALACNNLAWSDLMIGRADLAAEADEYSRKAIERMPLEPAVQGTRGAVLVELGRIEEDVALLNQCLAKTEDKNSKALLNCSLAIAERKRGNSAGAELFLETARSLDASCLLLKRAESSSGQSAENTGHFFEGSSGAGLP
ncbi:MAG: hypothetical protein JWR26_2932 [Pedosphaera sp.]|nr:hypothetical protein [Pedosphaera sp.]